MIILGQEINLRVSAITSSASKNYSRWATYNPGLKT